MAQPMRIAYVAVVLLLIGVANGATTRKLLQAEAKGTTVAAITAANPGIVATALQIGQTIQLPGCSGDTNPNLPITSTGTGGLFPGFGSSCSYTIKSGDTLFAIAEAKGTTVAAITAANPGIVATALQIGQVINLPGCSGSGSTTGSTTNPNLPITGTGSGSSCSYTIKSGDTLFAIAEAKGTTVAAITAANPGIVATALQIGQTIKLPGCT